MVAIADKVCSLEPFFIEFEQSYLHGDMLPGESGGLLPNILFLHGDEQDEDRRQFFLLRQLLFKQYGLSSCVFDFMGHGSTGGDKQASSLQQRTQQANDIVDACFDGQPFSIVAVGMGAYTALKLVEMASVRHLVLLVPKLYCHALYSLSFGEVASERLGSCFCSAAQSDALAIMQRFHGNLCLVAAEQETGGSHVIELLHECAVNTHKRHRLDIPGKASHIMEYANNDPLILGKIADSIADTCQVA
jgi:pimeloyl-ACP methyl ester carboxylesterase